MKVQNLAIIFIVIILPITLLLSSYTKTQIDAISIQTQMATKLRDATYDGITAFQLNTAENKYSSVSDSMRRDVTAAIQTFISSFAKNIGMSGATETTIKPYIPAVVFTLYDGYYIYSPSFSYINLDEENQETVDNDYDGTEGKMVAYDIDKDGNVQYDEKGNIITKKVDDKDENDILDFKIKEDARTYSTEEVINSFKSAKGKKGKYEHVLKPYIYYTARYVKGEDTDIVVNYSLDNYMVVYGKIKGKEVTNAGYLELEPKVKYTNGYEELRRKFPVTTIAFSTDEANRSNRKKGIFGVELNNVPVTNTSLLYDRYTNSKERITITDAEKNSTYSLSSNSQIEAGIEYTLGWYIGVDENNDESKDFYVDPYSAAEYYDEAYEFTKWVDQYLGDIEAKDARRIEVNIENGAYKEGEYKKKIIDENGKEQDVEIFGNEKIFNFFNDEGSGDAIEANDPTDNASIFNEHKREIIKLSIEDNLKQAITTYNQHSEGLGTNYNFKMPILSEVEWDKVLKNVCMITFVQGLHAGTKIFNDYTIVTSTKNKEYVSPSEIYYINEDTNGNPTGDGKYHRIGCSHLNDKNIIGYKSSDFDKQYYEYEDFEREGGTSDGAIIEGSGPVDRKKYYGLHDKYEACYYCIVNSTKKGEENEPINGNRKWAYNMAIAREKYNFYKVNTYLRERKADLSNIEKAYHANTYKEPKVYTIEYDDNASVSFDVRVPNFSSEVNNCNKFPLVIVMKDGLNWQSSEDKFRGEDYAICYYNGVLNNANDLKAMVYYMSQKDYVDKNNIFVIGATESAKIIAEAVHEYEQMVKAIVLISPTFEETSNTEYWNNVLAFKKSVLLITGTNETSRKNKYDYAGNRINAITRKYKEYDEIIVGRDMGDMTSDLIIDYLRIQRRK